MIEIRTKSGVTLDLAPDAEFEIEMSNPLLEGDGIPVAFSTSITFPPTETNRTVFGYLPAMMLPPTVLRVGVYIYCSGIQLLSGSLVYDNLDEYGNLNYTFTERELEDDLNRKIWQLDLPHSQTASEPHLPTADQLAANVRSGSVSGVGAPLLFDPDGAVTKFHNIPTRTTETRFTPCVSVRRMISAVPAFKLNDNGAIYSLDEIFILGLHKDFTGNIKGYGDILSIANSLPDVTLIDVMKEVCKMLCATIYKDGDKYALVNFALVGYAVTNDWDAKVRDTFTLSGEPAQGYGFGWPSETSGNGGSSGGSSGGGGGGGGGGPVTSVGLSMPTGFSVQGSPVTGQGTFTVNYTNGYSLPTTAKQDQWDNKQNAISDLEQIRTGAGKGATAYQKPQNGIPSTDLASGVIPDVSDFITRLVNDLVNYYTKSETYTKAEVAALIGAIQTFHYEIAASTSAVTSPSNNVLYLIGPTGSGADKYEEYVYDPTKAVNERWVKIGDTSIDISGLLPKTGGTLTGDLRLKPANANYGLRIRFGDGDYVYILEDSDDHLIIYADRGIDLNTSSGYDVKVNGVALTPADYVTLSTAQTITGEKTFTTKPVHIGSSSGIDVDGSSYIDIGDARLKWDANNHSLYATKRPGSSYTGDINLIVDGDVGAGAPGTGVSVKYVNCANQSAYNNISPKDPGTIYTVGTAPSFSKIYLGTILIYGS